MARMTKAEADALQDAHESIETLYERLTTYGGMRPKEAADIIRVALDGVLEQHLG